MSFASECLYVFCSRIARPRLPVAGLPQMLHVLSEASDPRAKGKGYSSLPSLLWRPVRAGADPSRRRISMKRSPG